MTKQIDRVIASGKTLAVIRKLVEEEYKKQDRLAWNVYETKQCPECNVLDGEDVDCNTCEGVGTVEVLAEYVPSDVTDKVDAYMLTIETAQSKEEAQEYLNSTDWYVARYGETGVAIPDNIKAKRAEARLIL